MRKVDVFSYSIIFIVIVVLAIWLGILFGGITGEAITGGTCECTTSATVEVDMCNAGYTAQCNGPIECDCVVVGPECSDSDGGYVITTKGTCTDESGSYEDVCENSEVIHEKICSHDQCSTSTTGCLSGKICVDGACVTGTTGSCGDGTRDTETEACDDGNTANGDGCSSTCSVESGYTCTGEPSVCTQPTTTDCTGTTTYGCDREESQAECNQLDECYWHFATYCTRTPCANHTDQTTCSGVAGCTWTGAVTVCGDGVVDSDEACDDGNTANADGCSSICGVEANYTCTGEPSNCTLQQTDSNETIDGCIDSDGGSKQNVFGICRDPYGTWEDYCEPDTSAPVVHEFACHANNLSCSFYLRGCTPNICVDGVCVEPNATDNGTGQGTTATPGEEGGESDSFFEILRGEPEEDQPYQIQEGETCRANECEQDEKCYPLGYRNKYKQYCEEGATWVDQRDGGGCSNHFECESNICIEGMCVQRAFIQRAIARFSCIFTGESCKGTGGYFVRLFGNAKAM